MPNQEFVFKQFKVLQDKCAMKVGTDAVLLGAWANTIQAKKILDIGTGTGIIALMLAQKSGAKIDAIDIDKDSFIQASENITNSNWKDRINVYQISLQEFAAITESKYELIVSNPPYFIDSSKALEESRTNARHTDLLPYKDLIEGVLKLLQNNGKFYVILPVKEAEIFTKMAEEKKMYLTKLLKVIPRTDKPIKRHLMRFELLKKNRNESEIVIEKNLRHDYTTEYKELTKDYYIYF
jgi:tRNA1Val (adenine37-N6)-methyltransferase